MLQSELLAAILERFVSVYGRAARELDIREPWGPGPSPWDIV